MLRYRLRFFLAFLMVLASNLLLILNPMIFREAVTVLDPTSKPLEGHLAHSLSWLLGSHIHSLLPWVLLLMTITFTSGFFKYHMRVAFIAISRDAETEARSLLFDRIQKQSLAFFDQYRVGELMSRLTYDTTAYRDVLGPGIMYPLYFITMITPALCALFTISSSLATLSLVPIVMLPLMILAIENRVYKTSAAVQKTLGEMSTVVHEHYSGIRVVKSYGMESGALSTFKSICQKFLQLNMRLVISEGMFFPFLTFITKCVTVLLLLYSGYLMLKAWTDLSVADFVSFMWIQSTIFGPILMLGWVLPMYIRGMAAYERMLEIYHAPIEVQDNPKGLSTIPPDINIELKNLTFSYPNSTVPVLKNLSIQIPSGSFVGITGPIGSGKSTLIRLLTREYETPKGMIFLDGHDIHDYKLDAIRQTMVTVEQHPFLFSKTINENVRFGYPDAGSDAVESALQDADLLDTVRSFPLEQETLVGERGVTLSGGQKQRLAIARAFLVERPILLLDDIFSAVDTGTERRIFQSLRNHFAGKTVLLITHRVSVLEQMDRVLYLMKGELIEEGTPADLMERQGPFAALVDLQHMQNEGVS